jgi:hypothetical protein
MVGRKVLENEDYSSFFENEELDIICLEAGKMGNYPNPIKYYHNSNKNLILFITPIAASDFNLVLNEMNAHLRDDISSCHILAPLIGLGYSEQHVVTAYRKAKEETLYIYDSKTSDVDKFFNQNDRSFSKWLLSLFTGLLNAARPAYKSHKNNIEYRSLGTQSLFDGVSCGYLTAGYLLAAKEAIENDQEISIDTFRNCQDAQQSMTEYMANSLNTAFKYFIKKAWQDTYMPLDKEQSFANYFLGWPKENGLAPKILYFASLGFIFKPLVSMLRLPTEFTTRAMAASADFVANEIYTWSPRNVGLQYLRSTALLFCLAGQAIFKSLALMVRTVTAPIDSFKKGWQTHKALGVLSVLISVTAYTLLAVFAAPAVVSALSSVMGSAFNTLFGLVIKDLALPFTSLIEMPASIAAAVTLITASTVIAVIKGGIECLFCAGREKEEKTGDSFSSRGSVDEFDMKGGSPSYISRSLEKKQPSLIESDFLRLDSAEEIDAVEIGDGISEILLDFEPDAVIMQTDGSDDFLSSSQSLTSSFG